MITSTTTLLIYRRTKIVATVGPASRSREMLGKLIAAGVNVFRLNMSHGTHEEHAEAFERIRAEAERMKATVAVLADLSGPKIRVGTFEGGAIELTEGEAVTVTTREVEGKAGLIPSQYEALSQDVKAGDRILLDDGKLALRVESVTGEDISARVLVGGRLSNRKGMNLPGVAVSAPALTPKDEQDARFAVELGVDFLALSFVRTGQDVSRLRQLIKRHRGDQDIIAKIEKPEALENIEDIVTEADGIMVARGDLGVELEPEAVPNAQEKLVELARRHEKPVIVATQMLESMITSPRPTRAEVSDVASAVRSGVDAVMLSAESAAGSYPAEAVSMMDLVVRQTEGFLWERGHFEMAPSSAPAEQIGVRAIDVAVATAAAVLSRSLLVRAIVAFSRSGRSMQVMSAGRPAAPIVGVSADERAMRKACLLWGVVPRTEEVLFYTDEATSYARQVVKDLDLAQHGDVVLVARGFHQKPERNMPSLMVMTV